MQDAARDLGFYATLGSYPGLDPLEAMTRACASGREIGQVQICPQNPGDLDEERLARLQGAFPETQFRLHANVRLAGLGLQVIDASSPSGELRTQAYFSRLVQTHRLLKAPAYTLHAGRRGNATFDQVVRNVLNLEQQMGSPVGVEGLYPSESDQWLLSSWEEYALLLESGVRYAMDLSHLHILRTATGREEAGLVAELLSSPRLIEVHVSGNDGVRDLHLPLSRCPRYWWHDFLDAIHPAAAVFDEGSALSARVAALK